MNDTRPATWPWARIRIEQRDYPALIHHWERGHPPGPHEWNARVTYLDGNQVRTALVPAGRVQRVG